MTRSFNGGLIPERFSSQGPTEAGWVPIVVRADLDEEEAASILTAIAGVEWGDLCHAYGTADDVAAQLAAITVGDHVTRKTGWWNLWGNIHHQGTIYAATVPAVLVLVRLADWTSYPDRAQAIFFLREVAEAEGVVVWSYDSEGDIVHDEELQAALTDELRGTVHRSAGHLLSSWRTAPVDVRRALILLLTSLPDLRTRFVELVDQDLPADLRAAWDVEASGQRVMTDETDALERWAHTGE
jgi:hypothetical protein